MLYNKNNLEVYKIASKDSYRPELTGVYFTKDKTIATDSYSLLEVSTPKNIKPQDFPFPVYQKTVKPFMLSASAVKELSKNLSRKTHLDLLKNVGIRKADKNKVQFIGFNDGITFNPLISKLEGEFPEYKQCFPSQKEKSTKIKVNAKYLIQLLQNLKNLNEIIEIKVYSKSSILQLSTKTSNQNQKGQALLMGIQENE